MAAVTQNAPAINYVQDATFTIQGGGNDDADNTPTPVGDTVTFFVDEFEVEFDDNLVEHAQGQAAYSYMRGGGQQRQRLRVRRKLETNDQVATVVASNKVILFTVTGTKLGEPFAISGAVGRRSTLTGTLSAPGTMEFALESMGVAWV